MSAGIDLEARISFERDSKGKIYAVRFRSDIGDACILTPELVLAGAEAVRKELATRKS